RRAALPAATDRGPPARSGSPAPRRPDGAAWRGSDRRPGRPRPRPAARTGTAHAPRPDRSPRPPPRRPPRPAGARRPGVGRHRSPPAAGEVGRPAEPERSALSSRPLPITSVRGSTVAEPAAAANVSDAWTVDNRRLWITPTASTDLLDATGNSGRARVPRRRRGRDGLTATHRLTKRRRDPETPAGEPGLGPPPGRAGAPGRRPVPTAGCRHPPPGRTGDAVRLRVLTGGGAYQPPGRTGGARAHRRDRTTPARGVGGGRHQARLRGVEPNQLSGHGCER